MAITRLSGGLTPANGSDPRTFPAIFNGAADDIEAAESAITALQSTVSGLEIDDLADVDITTPADGEVLTYDSGDWVNQALPASGKILQVVSTAKTDVFTTSSTSFTNVTGMSATITPTSTSSKILVLTALYLSRQSGAAYSRNVQARLQRAGTTIYVGDADGSRERALESHNFTVGSTDDIGERDGNVFLDSPSTTSAITYQIQMRVNEGVGNLNRNSSDQNNNATGRVPSSITLLEVSA
jgi:hypothetical protein